MSNKTGIFSNSLPFILVLSDLVARLFPFCGAGAAVIWIVATLLLCAVAALDLLVVSVKGGSLIAPAVIAAAFAADIYLTTDPRFVQHETSQQIGCAVEMLSRSDLGFLSSCFLGYPTRGYYLGALPSILFEHSPLVLNGFQHLLLFAGLSIFASGAMRQVPGKGGALLALSGIALGLSSSHAAYLYKNFEQSLYPVSLSFMFAGYLLGYLASGRTWMASLAASTAIMASFSYTPALALSALAIAVFLLLARKKGWCHAAFAGLIAISFVTALLSRFDLRLKPAQGAPSNDIVLSQLGDRVIRWHDNSLAYPAVLCGLIALLALVPLLVWLFKNQKSERAFPRSGALSILFLAAWAFLVSFVSIRSPGYANPDPNFALHRASLIFPLIAALLVFLIARVERFRFIPVMLTCALGVYGAYETGRSLRLFIRNQPPNLNFELLTAIKNRRAEGLLDKQARHLYEEQAVGEPFMSIMDFNQYFQTLEFFKSIGSCDLINKEQKKVLILKRHGSHFCKNEGTLECQSLNFKSRPELELCELSVKKPDGDTL